MVPYTISSADHAYPIIVLHNNALSLLFMFATIASSSSLPAPEELGIVITTASTPPPLPDPLLSSTVALPGESGASEQQLSRTGAGTSGVIAGTQEASSTTSTMTTKRSPRRPAAGKAADPACVEVGSQPCHTYCRDI